MQNTPIDTRVRHNTDLLLLRIGPEITFIVVPGEDQGSDGHGWYRFDLGVFYPLINREARAEPGSFVLVEHILRH